MSVGEYEGCPARKVDRRRANVEVSRACEDGAEGLRRELAECYRGTRLAGAETEARIRVTLAPVAGLTGVFAVRMNVGAMLDRECRMITVLVVRARPIRQRIAQEAHHDRNRPGERRAAEAE